MDPEDLRDPAAERRLRRLTVAAVVVLVALALGAAGVALVAERPPDHFYRYFVTFENPAGAAYTLLVPLPADAEWQARWVAPGGGTARVEDSPFGRVLRLAGFSNMTAAASLDTLRDVPLTMTTEGPDLNARPQAHVFFNATGPAPGAFLKLSLHEIAPTWNTSRFVEGDLFEGWNTIAVREEPDHA